MLKKIECFIQPFKLEEIKDALIDAGVEGITLTEVKGFGKQRGYLKGEIPNKDVKFLPKIKILRPLSQFRENYAIPQVLLRMCLAAVDLIYLICAKSIIKLCKRTASCGGALTLKTKTAIR